MKRGADGQRLLRQARRRIGAWRSEHRGRGRMPHALWELAAEAAAQCGVEVAAAELGLNAQRLEAWRGASAGATCEAPGDPPPAFTELPWPWAESSECVLELASPGGKTLRIRLTGEAVVQAEALVKLLGSVCT